PTVVMMRAMIDNALRDRDEAIETETSVYRDQLIHLVNRISLSPSTGEGGDALFSQIRRIFGDEVSVVVREPEAKRFWKWGDAPTADAIVAEIPEGPYAGWSVVLDHVVELPEYIGEQMRYAWWKAGGFAAGVVIMAAIVWFAVHRGLRIDELRSDQLTTVSHEMRTPLASMRVLLETLTDEESLVLGSEAKRREYLDLVLKENLRLSRLTEDFLTFARLERGEHRLRLRVCDLDEIAGDVLEELAPAIETAEAELEWNIDPGINVRGDADAIAAVIRNLLENALKYGASGDKTPRITLSTVVDRAAGVAELAVSDRGPGIPAEFRKAVFRRYFRVDSRLASGGSGVGLGLAICRHLVRQMRGRIRLEPNLGGGCRFVVRLPLEPMVGGDKFSEEAGNPFATPLSLHP
ncbi:MAG: HAMP domain-containing histidine kinase, partial [Verrucomicrobiae bacterium]|nr:HAMP domain-containing histidine kinase [Verrucomicrobiae bacterium]